MQDVSLLIFPKALMIDTSLGTNEGTQPVPRAVTCSKNLKIAQEEVVGRALLQGEGLSQYRCR